MRKLCYLLAFCMPIISGCSDENSDLIKEPNLAEKSGPAQLVMLKMDSRSNARFNSSTAKMAKGNLAEMITVANLELVKKGMQISKVDYYGAQANGNTIFFNDRGNKQLSSDFVPGDPRREGRDYLGQLDGHKDILYVIDEVQNTTSSGLTGIETRNAISSAAGTWNDVSCSSGLEINDVGVAPFDVGFVQWLIGFGGTPAYTDVMHAGFLPAYFFDFFVPGGGSFILGATFTFTFIDPNTGIPSDIDNNGKDDVAFAETYYNDGLPWGLGEGPSFDISGTLFDVETVALHEMGHGLSQEHFGKAFANNAGLHFSPRALMNAGYSGVQIVIEGTDKAGHCSNWGSWPNK